MHIDAGIVVSIILFLVVLIFALFASGWATARFTQWTIRYGGESPGKPQKIVMNVLFFGSFLYLSAAPFVFGLILLSDSLPVARNALDDFFYLLLVALIPIVVVLVAHLPATIKARRRASAGED